LVVFSIELMEAQMHRNYRRPFPSPTVFFKTGIGCRTLKKICYGCNGTPTERRKLKKRYSKQARRNVRILMRDASKVDELLLPIPKKTLLWDLA
jgi:hypothetical protein